jgi:hypothetical protein
MHDDDLKLDGNAAGGLLQEIFPFDLTTARAACAHCGRVEPVANLAVYVHAPGTVVRCVGCESVLIRIVHGAGRYWIELRGASCVEILEPQ